MVGRLTARQRSREEENVNNWKVWELVATSADRVPWPRAGGGEQGRLQEEEVRTLADELCEVLVPVVADASFRRRLHGDLLLEAQRCVSEQQMSVFQQHRTGILVGAAAIGSIASLAGVIVALVLRNRDDDATEVAAG